MCLLVVAWNVHPRYRLVLAANRDEFHDRPAAPLGWWQDTPGIVAGRDLRGSGTWMGVARSGRFGVVTNFRDLEPPPTPDAPSRGELVPRFLAATTPVQRYLRQLHDRAARYAGFNLLVGNAEVLHYYSNRNGMTSTELTPGVYGLSNHLLDSPWPKVLRTRERLGALVYQDALEAHRLFDLLDDRMPAEDDQIVGTGLPPDWERALSAPFVVHDRYGTRCSTLLFIEHGGRVTMHERRFDATGQQTGATRWQFDAEAARDRRAGAGYDDAAEADTLHEKFDTSIE
ncbi:MAG: hypothetical protein K0R70_1008 [Steroidobacteraceae bacterium]|nr:hypothetical protein [Steroidobacteraceae bacterium]